MYDGVRKRLWINVGLGVTCGLLMWAFFSTVMVMFGLGDFYALGMHLYYVNIV